MGISFMNVVCSIGSDNAAGAQTEGRGGAGPVRGLLGGKDLTGRFHLLWALPIRTQYLVPRGGHGGPPGRAAHARGQRADAAIDQADLEAAGVRRRGLSRI